MLESFYHATTGHTTMIPDPDSMTDAEVRAWFDSHAHRYRGAPHWSAQDKRESAAEILAVKAGERLPEDPHPLTRQRLATRSDWTTVDLLRDILAAQWGGHVVDWSDRQILAHGAGTAELGELYHANANRRLLTRQPRLLDKVFAFCAPTEAKDFKPQETGLFDLEVGIDTASDAIREWQTMKPKATSEAVALRWSPVRLRFTEQLIVDDNFGAINGIVDAVSVAAAQNELSGAFGVLTDNGNLRDSSALFVTANTVSGASKNAAAIDSAISKLRAQTLNDASCDAEPSALLVPAEDEATARGIIAAASANNDWLRLVATAFLPSGAWYLTADPTLWPCIVRQTMRGNDGQSLRFSPGTPNEREGSRDVILEGLHAYRYAATGRAGLVKIEVS